MKINVKYIETDKTIDMVKLDNGKMLNCGGRSLPF